MTTREQVIAAAEASGIKRAFVCAKPDECPDDDDCCHSQRPDGYWVKDEQLERLYAIVHEEGRVAGMEECIALLKLNAGACSEGSIARLILDSNVEAIRERKPKP